MKTINKGAAEFLIALRNNGLACNTIITHRAYINGAKQVIDELRNVLSVSEDEYLRTNLEKMIDLLEDREREEMYKQHFEDFFKHKK